MQRVRTDGGLCVASTRGLTPQHNPWNAMSFEYSRPLAALDADTANVTNL